MNVEEPRAAVRRAYAGRCGYCDVHEDEAGAELEIDHYRPRSAGGTDELTNLVYCCTTCNRLKGDFWPAAESATAIRRLLHPQRDDLSLHLREEADGRLIALTETAGFHLTRLRLNRQQLVALRRARADVARLRARLAAYDAERAALLGRIAGLERDLERVLAQIAALLDR
jgi:hypothetical protein